MKKVLRISRTLKFNGFPDAYKPCCYHKENEKEKENGNFDDLRDSLSKVPFEIAASADINEFWDNWKALFLSAV